LAIAVVALAVPKILVIDTFDGQKGVLAHVNCKSRFRVGRYGVQIETIGRIAVPALKVISTDDVIIIDEIGKMECFSSLFRKAILELLDSPNPVLATIAVNGGLRRRLTQA
jgi:nucleoside-triphosphatase